MMNNDNDNNDNDNDNESVAENVARADLPLLHDLDHYVRMNGITQEAAGPNLNEIEEARRFTEFEEYQKSVHKSIFEEAKQSNEESKKKMFLEIHSSEKIALRTAKGDVIEDLPFIVMASKCDTIYSIASSRFTCDPSLKDLCFDLQHFEHELVGIFINVLFRKIRVEEIPDDSVIDCLKLSHYLQCSEIFQPIIQIIETSIDAKNCISICQLADQLQIPSLFETSLSFMVGTFNKIQNHELWEELPTVLQNRLLTLRSAVQSSILCRGHKSKVFFHSSQEFLAIFSDNIREVSTSTVQCQTNQKFQKNLHIFIKYSVDIYNTYNIYII